jgi:hypothetical protein
MNAAGVPLHPTEELLRRLDAAVDDTERAAILTGTAPKRIDELQTAIAYRRLGPEAAEAAWWEFREIVEIWRGTCAHCPTCTCTHEQPLTHCSST